MVFTGRFSKTVLASRLLLVCLPTIGGSAWRLSQHRRTRSPRDDRLTSQRSTSARRRSTARGNDESEPQRSTARCDRNRGAAGAQASRHSSWRDRALAGRAARRRRAPVAVVSREREDRAQPPPERRRRNHGGGCRRRGAWPAVGGAGAETRLASDGASWGSVRGGFQDFGGRSDATGCGNGEKKGSLMRTSG